MSTPTGSELQTRSLVKRIAAPFIQQVRLIATSGLTLRKLVLTLCVGGAMGILPLVWGTSFICFWLAHRFGLNHLVLQSINYLLYPLQIALLIPFCKLGLLLVPWGPTVAPDQLLTLAHSGLAAAFTLLLWLSCKALIAWLVTVPAASLLVYLLLLQTVVRRREADSAVVTGL